MIYAKGKKEKEKYVLKVGKKKFEGKISIQMIITKEDGKKIVKPFDSVENLAYQLGMT